VRRIGDDIRVFVTEGKVRLEEGEGSSLPSSRERKAAGDTASGRGASLPVQAGAQGMGEDTTKEAIGEIFIAAGGVARTDGDGILVEEKSLADVEESLSWRTGYVIFHESTLADAVTEFNRYNVRQIFIKDFEAFVRLIEGGFSLHAQESSTRIVLTKN